MNSLSLNKKPLPLNENNLESIQSTVLKPNYIRSNLSAGILHIGVGNFHRAHLSWYLHRLMQKDLAKDWAIIAVSYTHLRAHETKANLVCRLLLEKKKKKITS